MAATSKQAYTYTHNAVSLVWGSLRLTPINIYSGHFNIIYMDCVLKFMEHLLQRLYWGVDRLLQGGTGYYRLDDQLLLFTNL